MKASFVLVVSQFYPGSYCGYLNSLVISLSFSFYKRKMMDTESDAQLNLLSSL